MDVKIAGGGPNIGIQGHDNGAAGVGRVGNLQGNAVQQARVNQQPARGSGLVDHINHFFGKVLPKAMHDFETAVRTRIASLFEGGGGQVAQGGGQVAQGGTQVAQATGQVAQGSEPMTAAEQISAAYDTVSSASQNVTPEGLGAFLRGTSAYSKVLTASLMTTSVAFAKTVETRIPDDRIVAFRADVYDPSNDKYGDKTSSPGVSVELSVNILKESWESFCGKDEASAKEKASDLPQLTKQLLASAFKAIDDSSNSDDIKGQLKNRICSDLMLRGPNPQIGTLLASHDRGSIKSLGISEIAKMMQNIANDIRLGAKEALVTEAVAPLGSAQEAMVTNLRTMVFEAARLGAIENA